MPVIPSVKYHLPGQGETTGARRSTGIPPASSSGLGGRRREPAHAAGEGLLAYARGLRPGRAAGHRARLAAPRARSHPARRRRGKVRLGLKLFNALDDDAFQLTLLREVHETRRPDFLVYANRLFDPDREFDGVTGVAYGGPDLSDRNLRLLTALRAAQASGEITGEPLEISGTGDIGSGRMALEYALRGCTSFQLHTLFQLPAEEFAMRRGSKVQRAIHRLYFDPCGGLHRLGGSCGPAAGSPGDRRLDPLPGPRRSGPSSCLGPGPRRPARVARQSGPGVSR